MEIIISDIKILQIMTFRHCEPSGASEARQSIMIDCFARYTRNDRKKINPSIIESVLSPSKKNAILSIATQEGGIGMCLIGSAAIFATEKQVCDLFLEGEYDIGVRFGSTRIPIGSYIIGFMTMTKEGEFKELIHDTPFKRSDVRAKFITAQEYAQKVLRTGKTGKKPAELV